MTLKQSLLKAKKLYIDFWFIGIKNHEFSFLQKYVNRGCSNKVVDYNAFSVFGKQQLIKHFHNMLLPSLATFLHLNFLLPSNLSNADVITYCYCCFFLNIFKSCNFHWWMSSMQFASNRINFPMFFFFFSTLYLVTWNCHKNWLIYLKAIFQTGNLCLKYNFR